jgi:hypothetical protein
MLVEGMREAMNDFRKKIGAQQTQQLVPMDLDDMEALGENQSAEVPAAAASTAAGSNSAPAHREPVPPSERAGKFLIVYTRNKAFARLHRISNSNCPWIRVQVRDCLTTDRVNENMYDSRCKICWPRTDGDLDESESGLSGG